MEKPLPNGYTSATDEDTFKRALADWLKAVEQLTYWHQELDRSIKTYENYPFGMMAAFRENGKWPKADLMVLRLTLCHKLAKLQTEFDVGKQDKDVLWLVHRFGQDATHLREWCQTIQAALGVASSASA